MFRFPTRVSPVGTGGRLARVIRRNLSNLFIPFEIPRFPKLLLHIVLILFFNSFVSKFKKFPSVQLATVPRVKIYIIENPIFLFPPIFSLTISRLGYDADIWVTSKYVKYIIDNITK